LILGGSGIDMPPINHTGHAPFIKANKEQAGKKDGQESLFSC